MKKCLLLLPVLLGLVACGHTNRVPTTKEIQRKAPPGALVHIIARDRVNPQRATLYTVDVSRDEIVAQTNDPAEIAQAEAESGSTTAQASGHHASATSGQFPGGQTVGTLTIQTTCEPKNEREGCQNVANLTNGDPHGTSGGGGDPTGHEEFVRRIRRLASLVYWSTLEVQIPTATNAAMRGDAARQ
ncbi:hypothetical protein LZ198_08380 [Myxococcus sp. K15C18031901]|uniref:hypothetical protein n=1 Tax=Myxococcus dinghuensis TaxID=2906761 RepID=UPI0020A82C9B|nr:hypothetical protein [Myxococcus dinghuensis]MCP3098890.1 hypothetical protein [Myxococcus dinghuensis]